MPQNSRFRNRLNQNDLRVQIHYKKIGRGSKIDNFDLEMTKIAQCEHFWTAIRAMEDGED